MFGCGVYVCSVCVCVCTPLHTTSVKHISVMYILAHCIKLTHLVLRLLCVFKMGAWVCCVGVSWVWPLQAAAEKKHTLKSDTQLAILQSLEAYFTHFKLTHTISRNLFLLDSMSRPKSPGAALAKPEKFVMLYDNLLLVGVA